jgi:hypothetical protein
MATAAVVKNSITYLCVVDFLRGVGGRTMQEHAGLLLFLLFETTTHVRQKRARMADANHAAEHAPHVGCETLNTTRNELIPSSSCTLYLLPSCCQHTRLRLCKTSMMRDKTSRMSKNPVAIHLSKQCLQRLRRGSSQLLLPTSTCKPQLNGWHCATFVQLSCHKHHARLREIPNIPPSHHQSSHLCDCALTQDSRDCLFRITKHQNGTTRIC